MRRGLAFCTGMLVGAALGYIVAISLPEERQKHLRETLVQRGEEVWEKARTVSAERARQLAEEAKRRVPETIPFARGQKEEGEAAPQAEA